MGRFPDGQFPNGRLVRHLGVLFEVPLVAQGQIEHRVHSVCGAVFTAVDDVGALCPQCAAIERRMGDTDGGR